MIHRCGDWTEQRADPITIAVTKTAGDADIERSQAFEFLLDHIDSGIMLLDAGARLIFANRAARHEMVTEPALSAVEGSLQDNAELSAAIAQVAQTRKRQLLTLGARRRLAYLVPMDVPGRRVERIALLLGRSGDVQGLSIETLGALFRLSASEREVLSSIFEGARPEAIATQRKTSISTVRSQIQNLREKLGVASVNDLVRFGNSLPPMMSSLAVNGSAFTPGAAALADSAIDKATIAALQHQVRQLTQELSSLRRSPVLRLLDSKPPFESAAGRGA